LDQPVLPSGTLRGNGTVAPNATVTGTLSAGERVGQIAFHANLTLASASPTKVG
jgi:hypothetical protein